MSWRDSIPKLEPLCHTHPLPAPDEHFCSCCRKGIISGLDNVVKVAAKPEGIFGLDGKLMGVEGHDRVKGYFHAHCFQENHIPSKKIIECKYCGTFSMAKAFKDGTPNTCKCVCHTNGRFCSLIIAAPEGSY